MLKISYRKSDWRAQLNWEVSDESCAWLGAIQRTLKDGTESFQQESATQLSIPWWSFISLRYQLSDLFRGFGLRLGSDLSISSEAESLLRKARHNADIYTKASESSPVAASILIKQLNAVGFSRILSGEQLRNVGKLAALPAAATFSVPGAGKTTEALAFFYYGAFSDEKLLVVAPKNAFSAWDEQLKECAPKEFSQFVRLRGGTDIISRLLETQPKFAIISYQQLARVGELVAEYCAQFNVSVFLDESHRIKSGVAKITARSVLMLSHLPRRKLILSGTPMPQALDDLVPQLSFLYPELKATADNVVDLMRPIYVRTTKKELGLPPVTRTLIQLPMAPFQGALYQLMKSEVAREAASALSSRSRVAIRSLGRSVARLLQFVSNPLLLAHDIGMAHHDILAATLSEGDGPKLKYVLKRARQLSSSGAKVLIWSSFVKNVEFIADRLSDIGAVYIHGGVDSGDEADDDTREGKIRLFHDDPNIQVLVANPAAASEGISLHKVCHHAIYLDRTFNAAHYLQSEDRIHRFGLSPTQTTDIEIVECINSVDETVRHRLNDKIGLMARALDDPDLYPDPVPLDPVSIDDYDEYSTGLTLEDINALLRELGGGLS
jgi:SNF2 family DNA or RNA helicase